MGQGLDAGSEEVALPLLWEPRHLGGPSMASRALPGAGSRIRVQLQVLQKNAKSFGLPSFVLM